MTSTPILLELTRTKWRLFVRGDDDSPTIVEHEFSNTELLKQSQLICDALKAHGFLGRPIVVAISSTQTLSAALSINRTKELRDRNTLLFRLEECVPWSAEECVADYSRASGSALAVAVHEQPFAKFFAELEKLDVQIHSIVPAALLAVSSHLMRDDWPTSHLAAFLHDGWIDLVFINQGAPAEWAACPLDGRLVAVELKRFAIECGQNLPVICYGFEQDHPGLRELVGLEVIQLHQTEDEAYDALMYRAAERILLGELDPPVELKRDAFGRNRQNIILRPYSIALQIAAAVLAASIAISLVYRGHVAARAADTVNAAETEVFKRVFPNTKVPIGIHGRLESELAKLKGLQGSDVSTPNSVPAVKLLCGLLTSLPSDRRIRLLEIRIEDGRLYLDGEVRDHGDAELIAQKLRSNGFDAPSPRTQRMDDKRISLRVTGSLSPDVKIALRKTR